MQESALYKDIDAVAVVAQNLVDAEFAKVGTVVPASALDQAGLRDGLRIVRDYLEHGEPGVALEHALYMLHELDLTIPVETHIALVRAARTMKFAGDVRGCEGLGADCRATGGCKPKMTTSEERIWRTVAIRTVGGLTEVGFSADERFLLVLSWQGRGVIDTRTGEWVAREMEQPHTGSAWLNEGDGTVLGIGPIDGVPVRCVGLWGGTLSSDSNGVVLQVRPSEVRLGDAFSGAIQILQTPITEVRAAGFSPSGDILVIATSGDVEILRRAG